MMEVCAYKWIIFVRDPSPHVSNATEYIITMPNMYARGILFGKMVLELGDMCIAKNEKHGLYCDLEFKTKVCVFCHCHLVS